MRSCFPLPKKPLAHGFTLIEVLIVIGVIGALGSIGYMNVSNARESAQVAKLESDVAALNSAVDLYVLNGGSIPSGADVEQIISKLKTRAADGSGGLTTAMQSSFVDARLQAVMQTSTEASTSQRRAVWDANQNMFVTTTAGGAGAKEFILNESLAAAAPTTENRTAGLSGTESGWLWAYSSTTPAQLQIPQAIEMSYAESAAQTATAHNMTAGPWTVGDSGTVLMTYVFRSASYTQRLGFASLEGLGPEVVDSEGNQLYDLDTEGGQVRFLIELLTRIIDGSASGATVAEKNLGQTVIDVSTETSFLTTEGSKVSVDQKATRWRPGDSLVSVMIPNGTFQQSLDLLTAFQDGKASGTITQTLQSFAASSTKTVHGISNNQLFPLASIEIDGTSRAPFYVGQYAALGENTSTYAAEDIQGGGDRDYNDIVFKAEGLEASDGITTVTDIEAFYGSTMTPAFRAALVAAGVLPF